MLTPLRCKRARCGHAWFTDAARKYPVCPKCRTSVARANTLRLVWPGEERPDGLHAWISVDITRYHRDPILVLNVAYDEEVAGDAVHVVEATVVDPKRFGLGALDLIDAIKDAGGNVTAEGQYPANRAIRSAVLAAMGWGTDAPGEHPPHLDDVLDRHRSEMRDTETAIRFRAAMDERDRRVAILAELEAGDLTVEEAAARYGTDADGIEEARRLHAAGQPIMDLAAYGVERIPASEVYAGDREDADAD
jgi:hypothetical protein